MAVSVGIGAPNEATLAVTLTRVTPASGVRTIWGVGSADWYLVYDDSLDDAGTTPSTRMRIPANTVWPIEYLGKRVLVAAVTGTVTWNAIGTGT